MWKNLILASLLIGAATVIALLEHDFDWAAFMLSFVFTNVLFQRMSEREQKKWLFPGGLLLSLAISGLYHGCNLIFFPHSAHTPQSFSDAYFGASLWVFGVIFLLALLSDRQKARLFEVI